MKAIIKENLLIVNAFDLNLQGKTVFGKILEIDLTERVTINFEKTKYAVINKPSCLMRLETDWDLLVDLDLEVFNLDSKPQFLSLFQEVVIAWEEYYQGVSSYVNLYNKFPEVETEILNP
jgi:hypothetical protein